MPSSPPQQRISAALLSLIIFLSAALIDTTNGFSLPASPATKLTRQQQYGVKYQSAASITTRSGTSSTPTSSSNFLSSLLYLSSNNSEDDHDSTTDDDESNNSNTQKKKKKKGDSIRSSTGIRPSLHPTTINCIAEALMLRSSNNKSIPIDVANSEVEPLQVAIAASEIAMKAINKHGNDGVDDEAFTVEESQSISGRVVGVVMRMRELEELLIQRVKGVGWVSKYGEEESFGVLRGECKDDKDGASSSPSDMDMEVEKKLAETIKLNPLFRMNRAECLLGLFLDTVERPKLELLGDESVAGGSEVDFIDTDRLEVLRSSS
jgi:hypothetical protein